MAQVHDKYTAEHIRTFCKSIQNEISKFTDYVSAKKEDALEAQRLQVQLLLDLEFEFQDAIRKHSKGPWAYQKFVSYITEEKGNILHARPYFRERQLKFKSSISPALKAKDARGLMSFRANFRLIHFIYSQRKWTSRIKGLYNAICAIRNEICVTNMPLAVSRARIFFSKTQRGRGHLSYLDLTQIAAEGLLSAIDKYVPPDNQPFGGLANIAINRMTGNFIEKGSETVLHFWPPDKRKLYNLHKLNRFSDGDIHALVDMVNKTVDKEEDKTSVHEASQLMMAASCVSTENTVESKDSGGQSKDKMITIGEGLAADPSWQPDNIAEYTESHAKLHDAIKKLTPFKRKLLKLKGIFV